MQSSFNTSVQQQVINITINGDLLGENLGPELIETVNGHLINSVKLAKVDLSNVRYINSSGIGVLITILTKLKNKGGGVSLVNPSDHVMKLLTITKLNAIFEIVNSKVE